MAKDLYFRGDSLDRIKEFPDSAKKVIGHELNEVQEGRSPSDFKPMTTVGRSVYEIRIQVEEGAFRTIYIAKFQEAIYVLHAFQKKSQKTLGQHIELARKRLNDLIKERSDERHSG